MATRTRARRGKSVKVNFTGVDLEGGGGSFHIPEGDYRVEVTKAEETTSKQDNPMIAWEFVGKEGKAKGKKFYYYTTMTDDSLWKLGQTLQALGLEVPDDEMDIDLEELIGLECMGVVIDDEYNGKMKSKLNECFAIGEEDTDTKPARGGKDKPTRGGKDKVEKIDASEVEAMAEDELADLVDKHDLNVDLKEHKTLRRKAKAVTEALDEAKLLA